MGIMRANFAKRRAMKLPSTLKAPLKYARNKLYELRKILRRKSSAPHWHNLRSLTPISSIFGYDRGTPIDRVYTNDFFAKNAEFIKGNVCEIAENTYTKTFGSNVIKSEILHYTKDNPNATIIGDLTRQESLPQNAFDCFICTVTLNFIYDYKAAIRGIFSMLKGVDSKNYTDSKNCVDSAGGGEQMNVLKSHSPNAQVLDSKAFTNTQDMQSPNAKTPAGVALVTVAGLVQISKYDYERWGDYWRFTDMGIKKDFEAIFGAGNVEVSSYGNVLAATAEIQGIAAEELSEKELFAKDPLYQVLICIVAKKY